MEKLVIIDGNSLINRAFYALPLLTNENGEYSNAVYGFANMLVKVISDYKPTKMAVTFDLGKPTFRHIEYSGYKATRKKMPEELALQLPILKEMLKKMNITIIEQEGFEADDLIGSLSKKFDCEKVIISGDKDLLQLIDDKTFVWHTKKGITDHIVYDREELKNQTSLLPYQIIEYKALRGDVSDNIPGVKGVGEKTATDLILKYGNIENLYQNIDEIKGKIKEKLIEDKENAFLSKWLATIKTDIEIDKKIEDFSFSFPFNNEIIEFFKRYEFKTLLKKSELFSVTKEEITKNFIKNKIIKIENFKDFDNLIESISQEKLIALHIDKSLHIATNNSEEFVIKLNDNLLNDGFDLDETLLKLKAILENKLIGKIVFDYKDLKHKFLNKNLTINNVVFDVSLANYLVLCGRKTSEDFDYLLENNSISSDCKASGLILLKEKLDKNLIELQMDKLYYEVEFPLIEVLFSMESNGIKMDYEKLLVTNENFLQQVKDLSKEIFDIIGKEVNLNSPKQLSVLLYEEMQLPNLKKGSTASEILEEISDYSPVIPLILKYRRIYKIQTYVNSFIEKLNKNSNKLHTIYQQKVTSTGRLSSIEPNLQNIPIKEDIAKDLRECFISSFENGYLISSDYSQIELRLLASFSKDKQMLYCFNNNIDIHTKTASEIFDMPPLFVTPQMRKQAKAINFGIVYGISDFGLSKQIHISVKEAKEYIKRYFNYFSSIKEYLDNLVSIAKEKGYSETILNRKRKIPELQASNKIVQQTGARIAMNTPLQGSASDIIKFAMIKVYFKMKEHNLKSKLILQIHDELVVDTHPDEVEQVKKILKDCMENSIILQVPLLTSISQGKSLKEK